MAGHIPPPFSRPLLIIFSCALLVSGTKASEADDQKTYIVYMGDRPKGDLSPSSLHTNILQQVVGSGSRASESLLHSYKKSFNGFVAKLTEEERNKLSEMEGVVTVFPNEKKQLHTTRSWDFMGFSQQVKRTGVESDIIVGMLDTGIWPESESFDDEGFGPPPTKWKGTCQSSKTFTCNNKVIGAKYLRADGNIPKGDLPSPRDTEGHGSHTASTAAGRIVSKASLFGLGSGTARGGVPSARIAVYKICWSDGCYDADILAAFDEAIADGVDIISLSVGGFSPSEYFADAIAIGAFHAMKKGILTSTSAGNSGPAPATITNFSPWSLSVAASTIDRKFVTRVKLGNGRIYEGTSVNTFSLKEKLFPLVYGPIAGSNGAGPSSRDDSEDPSNQTLRGTIVLSNLNDGEAAFAAGAVGTIMVDEGLPDAAFLFPLPATVLNYNDGTETYDYINGTRNPTATIDKSIQSGDELAPYVVSFSSRGPNPITSDILKPDLTAPGVDILAAWSEGTSVTGQLGDKRVVPYNIISGTSMACPHATGAAAYVKSFHPEWSPAAIKSALMTTASSMSASTNSEAELAYGSGQIDPRKATKPGLVYDAGELDYIKFLCGQGYNDKQLRLVTGDKSTSCSLANHANVWELNYPSFALSGSSKQSVTRTFPRTVTNVGFPGSTYKATVVAPPGMKIKVKPSVLSFTSKGQKRRFAVTISAKISENVMSGSLVWDDGVHKVRSPIVAYASLN